MWVLRAVLPVRPGFRRARDSTFSDIELNPGPSSAESIGSISQNVQDAYTGYIARTRPLRTGLQWLLEQWMFFRSWAVVSMPWPVHVLEALGRMIERVSAAISLLGQLVMGAIFTYLEKYAGYDQDRLVGIISMGLDFMSLVDPRHRLNTKPVWALLWYKTRAKMTRAEETFYSIAHATFRPSADYADWSNRMASLMDGIDGAETSKLSRSGPARQVFYPKKTFGLKEYEDLVTDKDVEWVETIRERKRLMDSLRAGNEMAIDQAWLSNAANATASLSRYTVPRPEVTPESELKIIESADAIFERYPELYENPQPMSVGAVMAASKWKYSAGLPFLPFIRKRATLRQTAWFTAIHQAAENILQTGDWPEVGFHAFPKAQVVSLSKLEDRSALRTVTAGDRITLTAVNTLLLESSKRVAPVDYLVFNQLPRREGAFQEVVNAFNERPHFASGDGRRFDATVVEEVATVGSVRLYERGVEQGGHYNDRAAISAVKAYYHAVCRGLIVNLEDGSVIFKTGGGGTGSARTTPDNRDWTRIVLVCGWSFATGRPCSEFWDHVTLGNASDDIFLSFDDETARILEDWKNQMFVRYGVDFSFQREERVENILHMIAVPEDRVDTDMYFKAEVALPDAPLMHNPARLLLMRSAYRSDRMSTSLVKSCTYLAEQAIGHSYLTAHSPETYSLLAQDYAEATTSFLSTAFVDVTATSSTNRNGHIVSMVIEVNGKVPDKVFRRLKRWSPGLTDSEIHNRYQNMARSWLKKRRFPSYEKVFTSWVTPEDWASNRPAVKRWSAVAKGARYMTPWADMIRLGLVTFHNWLDRVPQGLKELTAEAAPLSLARPFESYDYIVELFIFRHAIDDLGRFPTDSEMRARIRESPFASATDTSSFLIRMSSPDVAQAWAARDKSSLPEHLKEHFVSDDAVAGRVIAMMAWYTLVDVVINAAVSTRFLGVFVLVFIYWTKHLDMVYSLLGLLFWIGAGKASLAISSVQPRDKYIVQKQLAAVLASVTPRLFTDHFRGLWGCLFYLSSFVDALSLLWHVRTIVANNVTKVLSQDTNPWIPVLGGLHLDRAPNLARVHVLLTGGTGLGKSTSMIATIHLQFGVRAIALVVPYRVLVQQYTNDFLDTDKIRLLNAGEELGVSQITGVVVMDTAKFLALDIDEKRRFDLVIFDEAHIPDGNLAVALNDQPLRVMCVTATPSPENIQWANGSIIDAPTIHRFERKEVALEVSMLEALSRVDEFTESPTDRVLILHPLLSTVELLFAAASGITSRVALMSSTKTHEHGDYRFLFATSVADNGINILPSPDLVIDSGAEFAFELPPPAGRSNHERRKVLLRPILVKACEAKTVQRAGRVARTRKGTVLRLSDVSLPEWRFTMTIDWTSFLLDPRYARLCTNFYGLRVAQHYRFCRDIPYDERYYATGDDHFRPLLAFITCAIFGGTDRARDVFIMKAQNLKNEETESLDNAVIRCRHEVVGPYPDFVVADFDAYLSRFRIRTDTRRLVGCGVCLNERTLILI